MTLQEAKNVRQVISDQIKILEREKKPELAIALAKIIPLMDAVTFDTVSVDEMMRSYAERFPDDVVREGTIALVQGRLNKFFLDTGGHNTAQ